VGRRNPLVALILVTLYGLVFAGIATGATLHGLWGARAGRAILLVSLVLLAAGIAVAAASFGLFLLPAAALAGIALGRATVPTGEGAPRST